MGHSVTDQAESSQMQELMVMGNGNCANIPWERDTAEYRHVPQGVLIQQAWGEQTNGRGLLCLFSPVKRNPLSMQGLKAARVRDHKVVRVYS